MKERLPNSAIGSPRAGRSSGAAPRKKGFNRRSTEHSRVSGPRRRSFIGRSRDRSEHAGMKPRRPLAREVAAWSLRASCSFCCCCCCLLASSVCRLWSSGSLERCCWPACLPVADRGLGVLFLAVAPDRGPPLPCSSSNPCASPSKGTDKKKTKNGRH